MLRRSAVLLGVLGLLSAVTATAGAVTYAIADLGVMGSYTISAAMGVNVNGAVTGYANTALSMGGHAFLATGGPPLSDINSHMGGGAQTAGLAISDTGIVAGLGYFSAAHAATYNTGTGVTTDLTAVPGIINGVMSWAYAVNNSGHACGWYTGSFGFFYNGSTTVRVPGLGDGTNGTYAFAMNNIDTIVGGGLPGGMDVTNHPYIWTQAGGTQTLFLSTNNPSGSAYGVNDSGVVVGGFYNGLAFYATATGGQPSASTIGALGTGTQSALLAVDNRGDAVGWSYTNGVTASHAFIYTPSAGLVDLNSTAVVPLLDGWTLTRATAISSDGRYIVGYGTNGAGQTHAFLLTGPVPEPGTLLLAATGLIGLLAYVWRRRK